MNSEQDNGSQNQASRTDNSVSIYEELLNTVADDIRLQADNEKFFQQWSEVGNYEVSNLLGVGGQAYCFRAMDRELQRPVAIKAYRSDLSDQHKEQVIREGRALAKIDSPYVAKCYAVDTHLDSPFLVLEFVEGKTLGQWALDKSPDEKQIRKVIDQLLEAVGAIHNVGLLHLDLKPGNVVIDQGDQVKLIDFGMALNVEEDNWADAGGSPAYVAPERLAGEAPDARSDIYGVGCSLFYLLTHRAPVQGDSREELLEKTLSGELDWEPLNDTSVNGDLVEFCRKCTALNRDERFASIEEARRFLPNRDQRRNLMMVSLASFVGLFIAGLVTWWAITPSGTEQIRAAIDNEDWALAAQLEQTHFQNDELNLRTLKSIDRSIQWAELAGDFELAARQYQASIEHLKAAEPQDVYEVQLREAMCQSAVAISKLDDVKQSEIRMGLELVREAKEASSFSLAAADEKYTDALRHLNGALPDDSILFVKIWLDFIKVRDQHDLEKWTTMQSINDQEMLQKAESIVKSKLGDHPLLAYLYHSWGHHAGYMGDMAKLQNKMAIGLEICEKLFSDGQPDHGELARQKYWIFLAQSMNPSLTTDERIEFTDLMVAQLETLSGENSFDRFELAGMVNPVVIKRGDSRGLELAQNTIDELRKMLIDSDSELGLPTPEAIQIKLTECLIAWAYCNRANADYEEDEEVRRAAYSASADMFKEAFELQKLETLAQFTSMREWARVLCLLGRFEESKLRCDQAADFLKGRAGPGEVHLITVEWIYALIDWHKGNQKKALEQWESLLQEAKEKKYTSPIIGDMREEYIKYKSEFEATDG